MQNWVNALSADMCTKKLNNKQNISLLKYLSTNLHKQLKNGIGSNVHRQLNPAKSNR